MSTPIHRIERIAKAIVPMCWAIPFSLAATMGILVSFFSSPH